MMSPNNLKLNYWFYQVPEDNDIDWENIGSMLKDSIRMFLQENVAEYIADITDCFDKSEVTITSQFKVESDFGDYYVDGVVVIIEIVSQCCCLISVLTTALIDLYCCAEDVRDMIRELHYSEVDLNLYPTLIYNIHVKRNAQSTTCLN